MDELRGIYQQAFQGVAPTDELRRTVQELSDRPEPRSARYVRRISGAMVAAVLLVVLVGCGVVASVYGDTIQDWFSHSWRQATGQQIPEEQLADLDRLSQPIGLSQTANGMTLTVDSAIVGNGVVYTLLHLEGKNVPQLPDAGMGYLQIQTVGRFIKGRTAWQDPDGRLCLLMVDFDDEFLPSAQPLEWTIRSKEILLVQREDPDAQLEIFMVPLEEEFDLSYQLDRSNIPPIESFGDGPREVVLCSQPGEEVAVPISELQVSGTGIYFHIDLTAEEIQAYTPDGRRGEHIIDLHPLCKRHLIGMVDPTLIMQDGTRIGNSSQVAMGAYMTMAGEEHQVYEDYWMLPVDMDQVAAVQIGETTIYK